MRCLIFTILVVLTALAACAGSHHTDLTAYPSGGEGDATDFDYESDEIVALMHESYRHAWASADTAAPEALLAEILAAEAHTQALSGATNQSIPLWSEAILLLEACSPIHDTAPSSLPHD